MPRVKRGTHRIKRRKNILKRTKGYRWGRKSKITLAKTAMLKAGRYAYRDRRRLKRDKRSLWIVQLNAALRKEGTHYAPFIHQLKTANVLLDRKILADLASHYGPVFTEILKNVK